MFRLSTIPRLFSTPVCRNNAGLLEQDVERSECDARIELQPELKKTTFFTELPVN
jgi:hypothetical protein